MLRSAVPSEVRLCGPRLQMRADVQDSDSAEKDVEDAFRVSPEFGLEMLHESFHLVILGCIKAHGLGLGIEDIDDVYQNTMIDMLRAAKEPDFDPVRPMRLVQDIAKKRTMDRRRRRRLPMRREGPEFHDHLIKDINGSMLGIRVKYDRIDWAEFDKALWEEIEKLPSMQKTAASCFVDVYEDVREQNSYSPLADAMGTYLRSSITVAAAKSAWHAARAKLASQLTRRGFNFLGEV